MSLLATAVTASLVAYLVWRGTGSWLRVVLDWFFVVLAVPVVALAIAAFVSVEVFRTDYRNISRDAIDMAVLAGNMVIWGYLAWLASRDNPRLRAGGQDL